MTEHVGPLSDGEFIFQEVCVAGAYALASLTEVSPTFEAGAEHVDHKLRSTTAHKVKEPLALVTEPGLLAARSGPPWRCRSGQFKAALQRLHVVG